MFLQPATAQILAPDHRPVPTGRRTSCEMTAFPPLRSSGRLTAPGYLSLSRGRLASSCLTKWNSCALGRLWTWTRPAGARRFRTHAVIAYGVVELAVFTEWIEGWPRESSARSHAIATFRLITCLTATCFSFQRRSKRRAEFELGKGIIHGVYVASWIGIEVASLRNCRFWFMWIVN